MIPDSKNGATAVRCTAYCRSGARWSWHAGVCVRPPCALAWFIDKINEAPAGKFIPRKHERPVPLPVVRILFVPHSGDTYRYISLRIICIRMCDTDRCCDPAARAWEIGEQRVHQSTSFVSPPSTRFGRIPRMFLRLGLYVCALFPLTDCVDYRRNYGYRCCAVENKSSGTVP